MEVLIVGGGIGGMAAALSLHAAGIGCTVFEQVRQPRELGVGINTLPHAIKELAALGLLPELDRAGIRTRELIYANRFGQVVWREPRGIDAGLDTPQFSIHRGRLHGVLVDAVRQRLGADAIQTGCRLVSFTERDEGVRACFERRDSDETFTVTGDALIGADGIHSATRAAFYPDEGPPVWNGTMLWRGAADWPVHGDGRTMVIAGGMSAKFVFYPIHFDPGAPARRLTNWAVMARVADTAGAPPRREDWNRPGQWHEVEPFLRDRFRLDFVDPVALVSASGTFYEYPLCDRDPLPRWSFGRATLLGDAAHPMYPVGSNGASQAVLDAAALARHLASGAPVAQALAAYDAERRPVTSEIVLNNRKGGPERVIDLLEARSPDGFDNVDEVASYAEREAIVRGYASMAGFARDQVNREAVTVQFGGGRKFTSCKRGETHHLGRVRDIVDRLEQVPQKAGRRYPEQAGDIRLSFIEQAVRYATRQADQVAGGRRRRLTVEQQVEFPFKDVDELFLRRMDVRRHERARRQQGVPGKAALRDMQGPVGLAKDVPDAAVDGAALLRDTGDHHWRHGHDEAPGQGDGATNQSKSSKSGAALWSLDRSIAKMTALPLRGATTP